jgi:hypothetical protein
MDVTTASLPTVEALRNYVRQAICRRDRLDPEATPLFEGAVTRRGKPCGLFFQVQGPRQVRLYALWAGEEKRILFYDQTGARIGETRLSDAPAPRRQAA